MLPKLRNYKRIHTNASQKLTGVGNAALLPYIYKPYDGQQYSETFG